MDRELSHSRCESLLDIGCGSGVLALAAAALGVPCAVGLDTDPRAVRVSLENARQNGLLGKTHWILGSSEAVRGQFDLVLANLPFTVIMPLVEDCHRLMRPDGSLVLSGFHDIQWHDVQGRLDAVGLGIEQSWSGDQSFYGAPPSGSFTWMAVLVKRRG